MRAGDDESELQIQWVLPEWSNDGHPEIPESSDGLCKPWDHNSRYVNDMFMGQILRNHNSIERKQSAKAMSLKRMGKKICN